MSEQIDTRITASLHPGNVRALADFSEADASFVGQVETAFSTAFEGLRQVHDAREAARRNPTWNEAQQIIATDDLARKTLDRATRAFDSAKANLDKTISSYEAQLTQPVEAKAALSVCAESLRKLPDRRRHILRIISGRRDLSQNVSWPP